MCQSRTDSPCLRGKVHPAYFRKNSGRSLNYWRCWSSWKWRQHVWQIGARLVCYFFCSTREKLGQSKRKVIRKIITSYKWSRVLLSTAVQLARSIRENAASVHSRGRFFGVWRMQILLAVLSASGLILALVTDGWGMRTPGLPSVGHWYWRYPAFGVTQVWVSLVKNIPIWPATRPAPNCSMA